MSTEEKNNNGLLTTTLLARLLGLTDQRVRDMAKEGIISVAQTKGNIRYFSFSAVTQYCEYIRSVLDRRNPTTLDEQKLQAEIKYKKAKARKAELETKELEGKMHSAEIVEEVLDDFVFYVRSSLLAITSRIATELSRKLEKYFEKEKPPATIISSMIADEVNLILSEFTSYQYDAEKMEQKRREQQGLFDVQNGNDVLDEDDE